MQKEFYIICTARQEEFHIEPVTGLQQRVGVQRLIDFYHPLLIVKHQNSVFHRIDNILMGDRHNIKHLIQVDRNDEKNCGYYNTERSEPRNDRQIIVEDDIQEDIEQKKHGHRKYSFKHVHDLIFNPGCLVGDERYIYDI
ncbi:hypothetical protein D3C75_748060 [compost metagenome]